MSGLSGLSRFMARPLRIEYAGAVYHVMARGNQGQSIFRERVSERGRVREQRCRHFLPSEPDVRVSPHPAQAATKPRVSGAGFTTG